jgi:hypothetical protein
VIAKTPLHTLRKQFGSEIHARYGLLAASEQLRHGGIAVTARHYIENRSRSVLGFGHLLKGERTIIAINEASGKACRAEEPPLVREIMFSAPTLPQRAARFVFRPISHRARRVFRQRRRRPVPARTVGAAAIALFGLASGARFRPRTLRARRKF